MRHRQDSAMSETLANGLLNQSISTARKKTNFCLIAYKIERVQQLTWDPH
jgi:hypothetical protein